MLLNLFIYSKYFEGILRKFEGFEGKNPTRARKALIFYKKKYGRKYYGKKEI